MARNPWPPHLDSITLCPDTIEQISDHNQNQKKSWAIRPLKPPSDLVLLIVRRSFRCSGWQTGASTFLDRRPIITQDDTDWLKRSKRVKDFSLKVKPLFVSDSLSCIRPVKCINPRISQAWFTVARLKCIKGRKFLKTSTVMNDAYRMPRTT